MSLPISLQNAVATTLREQGDSSPILHSEPIGGGDISNAAQVTTVDRRYFVKWHNSPPTAFFECEARGLSLIASAGAVRVPRVVGTGIDPAGQGEFLILEWIDRASKTDQAAQTLGRRLAEMHKFRQPHYGLDHDNYIGRSVQPNTPSESWIEFYGTRRLGAQRDLAARLGHLTPQRARQLDRLIASLGSWIDEHLCQPSLLHGDLWGGNWIVSSAGEPIVIDPAVYLGDREADLAMTTLFGGFPRSFYAAYEEVFPLAAGYSDREPIYQLYHLLNHLNLFGESYGSSVDSILRRFAG